LSPYQEAEAGIHSDSQGWELFLESADVFDLCRGFFSRDFVLVAFHFFLAVKDHLEGPGYHLPVYAGDGVYTHNPALIVVLAWRYADAIASKHGKYIASGGRFLVPLPDISYIP
jgi:hypothetical protein